MNVYAVCPMSQDVACGHSKPDVVCGKFEDAQQYVFDTYEGYMLAEHYSYDYEDEKAAWYYSPNGEYDEESNVVIIEYKVR